jgi:hypothetical protein
MDSSSDNGPPMMGMEDAMSKVKHKAGFITTDGIRALSWNTETSATIWWEGGLIGTFEFDALWAETLKMFIDHDAEWEEKHIRNVKERGLFWLERERAEHDEDMNDYRAQRKALREQGVYTTEPGSGRWTLRIQKDDGTWNESSGRYGPDVPERDDKMPAMPL